MPLAPFGNTALAMAMWPLSTRVKRSRISALGLPTAMVRVMSVVPSWYCAPESSRKSPLPILRLRALGDAVMHDGAVRPRAGDRGERHFLELLRLAAEGFQRHHRVDLGHAALGRFFRRTTQGSAITRRAVAQVRGARAANFGGVLARLHQRDRIGAEVGLAAGFAQGLDEPREGAEPASNRTRARSRASAATSCRSFEAPRRPPPCESASRTSFDSLRPSTIEPRPPLCADHGEGQRQGRVRHVGAANVERPRHIVRVGDDERVGACELAGYVVELLARVDAGEASSDAGARAPAERRGGRSRARRPDCRRQPAATRSPCARPSRSAPRSRASSATDRSRARRRAAGSSPAIRPARFRRCRWARTTFVST